MIEAEQGTELQSTAHGKEGTALADVEGATNLEPGIRIHPTIISYGCSTKAKRLRHVIIFLSFCDLFVVHSHSEARGSCRGGAGGFQARVEGLQGFCVGS